MAKNVLIIGAGGVAQVVAHKVAQNAQEFGTLHIASRTVAKADKIIASIREKGHQVEFSTHPLDAMDSKAVAALKFTRERLGERKGASFGCPAGTVLSHRARLVLPGGQPLALVVECYTRANLRALHRPA